MALVTEYLNGGLVTARDATELVPGELQQSDECVYRLHDPAIWGRPGRTQYNTTTIKDSTGATCAVKGLARLSFETHTDQILALGGDGNNHGTLWNGDFTAIDGTATFTKTTGPGQVTDAQINNSTTITSASGGFANMVQGAHVTGTGIPANSVVVTVTSSTSIIISNTTTGGAQTVTATFDMGIAVAPADSGAEIISTVQWGDSYYVSLANGNVLRAFFKSRSIPTNTSLADLFIARPAGLDPVILQPTVSVVAGTWPSVLGNGYYWFLITEILNPGQIDEVEGTYTPKDVNGTKVGPVAAQITDYTTQTIQITRPAQVNNGINGRLSTHWCVYMSPKQADNLTVPSLATFRRIAVIPMTDSVRTLTDTSASVNTTQTKYAGATAVFGTRPQFTNPNNMVGLPDGQTASAGSTSPTPMNKLQNFGFSTSAPFAGTTVTGIRVRVYGLFLPAAFNVYLTTTGGKSTGAIFGAGGSYVYGAREFGGQFDTQGVAWVPSDFANGTFEVYIERVPGVGIVFVDSVEVTVFYSGGAINLNGPPFRVVTYRDEIGVTVDDPAQLPPPPSSTADIFQGSIVSNDLTSVASIRWCLPGSPEAWPKPYVLAFNSGRKDVVTCLKTLNQNLIVGLKETVRRVNYLPSEIDTDFHEGIAHEPITEDHGIVGPLAAVRFSRPGGRGSHLAFVSYSAFMMTDGVTADYLNRDIKVSTYLDPAFIGNCIFRNYPKEQWLVLFYTPVGGTKNTKALIFSYDQPKEDGSLRAIGPITVSARSACSATLSGVPILLTGHSFGGKIYVEDQGSDLTGYTTDGSTQVTAAPSIITRRFYPAGLDRNARTEKQYVQHAAAGTSASFNAVSMTAASATITRAAGWGSVTKGQRLVHTNIPGDAIVVSVSGTSLVMSQPAFEAVTGATVVIDTGTLSVTVRGQNIGQVITEIETTYSSTLTGGLLSTNQDAHAQAFDLMLEKVRMPDDTLFDLNTALRIHHFTYEIADGGKEQSRSGAL